MHSRGRTHPGRAGGLLLEVSVTVLAVGPNGVVAVQVQVPADARKTVFGNANDEARLTGPASLPTLSGWDSPSFWRYAGQGSRPKSRFGSAPSSIECGVPIFDVLRNVEMVRPCANVCARQTERTRMIAREFIQNLRSARTL
jgi:hypothetical protein